LQDGGNVDPAVRALIVLAPAALLNLTTTQGQVSLHWNYRRAVIRLAPPM